MQSALHTIGRIAYAIPFAVFGISHFTMTEQTIGMVPGFFPAPIIWVYLTGIALIAASLSIIFNIFAHIAGICLALMLLIFIGTMHIPALSGEMAGMAMVSILKDTALAGAALLIASLSIPQSRKSS